ncbi:nesprin-2-like [Arapaima gigas]
MTFFFVNAKGRLHTCLDLSKAKSRTNQQNLEEAFCVAEQELHIPRLLEPRDVDISDPDEKSIMTYVAQFLQYSKDLSLTDQDLTSFLFTPTLATFPEYQVHSCMTAPPGGNHIPTQQPHTHH